MIPKSSKSREHDNVNKLQRLSAVTLAWSGVPAPMTELSGKDERKTDKETQ